MVGDKISYLRRVGVLETILLRWAAVRILSFIVRLHSDLTSYDSVGGIDEGDLIGSFEISELSFRK